MDYTKHIFWCDTLIVARQFGIWDRSFVCRKFGKSKALYVYFLFNFFLHFVCGCYFVFTSCLKVKVTGISIVWVSVSVSAFCHNRKYSLFGDDDVGGSVGHLFCNVCMLSLMLLAKLLYYFSLSLFHFSFLMLPPEFSIFSLPLSRHFSLKWRECKENQRNV